jgi:acyl-coenzyme A synthetase/AMP-(fatty) acid ligase
LAIKVKADICAKALLTSPRNSLAAHEKLFRTTGCTTVVTSDPIHPAVPAIVKQQNLKLLQIPSLEELCGKQYPPYRYDKTYEEAHGDPLVILHTSGSTGQSKRLQLEENTDAFQAYQSQLPVLMNTFPPLRILLSLSLLPDSKHISASGKKTVSLCCCHFST